jgi:uncharacterized membrane protein YjjB (DUF3815 family)
MTAIDSAPERSSNGRHDVTAHRYVVLTLGLTALGTVVSITVLALFGHDAPPSLTAIGSAAVGALTGMLAAIMKEP